MRLWHPFSFKQHRSLYNAKMAHSANFLLMRQPWIGLSNVRTGMRGTVDAQSVMICLISPESQVPKTHPLCRIKQSVDEELHDLSPLFEEMYAQTGRPAIPPERLLKASVLEAL
jgi:hypothetical protein